MRLSQEIINKKIKMNFSETDVNMLKELTLGMESDDRKLVLIEDFCLLTLFKRAIRILENNLKLPQRNERKRPSKKTSCDRSW